MLPICRKVLGMAQRGTAALHAAEPSSLVMERGKHSVLSRFFAVRECRHKSSPPSSHRTILAAYLPPTPQKLPRLAAPLLGGNQMGAAWVSEVLPLSRGYVKLEQKPG